MDAEKNKISTGTLTYEDIRNKAEYEAGSMGINIDTSKDADKKEAGVTPNIGMPVEDKAESDTKATIAEGEIEIRNKDKQKQDLKDLNRDTRNSLNKLGEIFDKTKVEEKQEFAGLFQEVAHSYIGDLTGKLSSEEKAVLNSLVDGLVAEWTSGNFLAGASGTALLESMQSAINEIKDPALKQIAAGMIGAVAGEIAGGNAQAGASSAVSTEKYNHLPHHEQENLVKDMRKAKNNSERFDVLEKYYEKSLEYKQKDPKAAEDMEQMVSDELAKLTKFDNAGQSFELVLNPNMGLTANIKSAKEFLSLSKVLSNALPNIAKDTVVLTAETMIDFTNLLSAGKIQFVDTTGNIIMNYNANDLPSNVSAMIAREAAKGVVVYKVHSSLEKQGVPKSAVIVTDLGIIIATNLVQ